MRTPKHARSTVYQRVLSRIDRWAPYARALVLIEGESGTGKTNLARYLHERSTRRDRPFQRVDLAALDDGLSGAELFGHTAGAYTGARGPRVGLVASANGGTLFLDELGKASLTVQRKLLHLIDRGEITPIGADRSVPLDVRIVAATNVSLDALVKQGAFLPDLLFRFGFFRVCLPPLRERRADMPGLVAEIAATYASQFGYEGRTPPVFDPALLDAMSADPWPGNIRELVSAVQYLLVAADGDDRVTLDHCEGALERLRTGTTSDTVRRIVAREGSVAAAARKLGVARTTVYRRLREEKATRSG